MNIIGRNAGGDVLVEHDKCLEELEAEELSGTDEDEDESLEVSETDEEEDEGVGDGNMTRGDKDPFKR
jgi:hypothetical protein